MPKKGFASSDSPEPSNKASMDEVEHSLRLEPLPDFVLVDAVTIARVMSECFYKYQRHVHAGITLVPSMSEFISYFADGDDAPFAEHMMTSYALRDPLVRYRMMRWASNFKLKPGDFQE